MKTAILLGASGFVGSFLLQDLLNDATYEKVIIVVRKELGIQHPKLQTIIGDYQALPRLKDKLVGDDLYIAIGTTKAKTPDLAKYYEIDHDYPLLAAQIVKANGGKAVFIVSAVSANAKSSVFYIRTKGEVERDIIALNFKNTHIFRPSLITGGRKENRNMESFFIKLWSVIDPIFIGKSLSKYKGMDGADIATAMVHSAKKESDRVEIYHWREMKALL